MRDNALTISHWWDFERPTLGHVANSLDLWCRYLFIFSLPVPERIPGVFQASHHFCGAMYGIVCKAKRGARETPPRCSRMMAPSPLYRTWP